MPRWPLLLLAAFLTGCGADSTAPATTSSTDAVPALPGTTDSEDAKAFWRIIGKARSEAGANDEVFLEALSALLDGLPAEAVANFEYTFDRVIARAYRWDLWGAAYAIRGGCSDDGFEYFRAWLVSQGEAVFTTAVASPDTLAEHFPRAGDTELELMLSVASDVFERKTGGPIPMRSPADLPHTDPGEEWDFDDEDEMSRRLPKLWARLAQG